MRRIFWSFVFLCLLGVGALALPTVEEVLVQVEACYARLASLELRGELAFEVPGFGKSALFFRAWAAHGRVRLELIEPGGARPPLAVFIADIETKRAFVSDTPGIWWEEELEPNQNEWMTSLLWWGIAGPPVLERVEEAELKGKPVWILGGKADMWGWPAEIQIWVDQRTGAICRVVFKAQWMSLAVEVKEFNSDVEVPLELLRVPPSAEVRKRPARSPQAEAIAKRVMERCAEMRSLYARCVKRCGQDPETQVEIYYSDPIMRVETRTPSQNVVLIMDLERGIGVSSTGFGKWEAANFMSVPPGLRALTVLGAAIRLGPRFRLIEVVEEALEGRPVWRIVAEPQTVTADIQRWCWWVDQQSYAVLQYEEPRRVWDERFQKLVTVVCRIRVEVFELNALVPFEKLRFPEGVLKP